MSELREELVELLRQRFSRATIIRLQHDGLKGLGCEACGVSEWRREPIELRLHHVNGDHLDDRPENLELLCPNCFSQRWLPGAPARIASLGPAEELEELAPWIDHLDEPDAAAA